MSHHVSAAVKSPDCLCKNKRLPEELQTLPFPYRNPATLLTAGTDRGFLTSFDIDNCEEPDPSIAVHTPFLSLTVRLAAMVHEPSVIALWPSINDSILQFQNKTKNKQTTKHI